MSRKFLLIAALLGFTGVALGAFGTHALQATLEANGRVDTFQTANHYHMYHALAVLLIGVLLATTNQNTITTHLKTAGYLFTAGAIIFSGSLYILAIADLGIMGAVAPLGGTALLAGWFMLGWAAWHSSRDIDV